MIGLMEQNQKMRQRRRAGSVPGGAMNQAAGFALRSVLGSFLQTRELPGEERALPGTTLEHVSRPRGAEPFDGTRSRLEFVPLASLPRLATRGETSPVRTPAEQHHVRVQESPAAADDAWRELQRTGNEILSIVQGLDRKGPGQAVAAP